MKSYNIEIRFKQPDPNKIIGNQGRSIEGANCYGYDKKHNQFHVYRENPFLDYFVDFDTIREMIIKEVRK